MKKNEIKNDPVRDYLISIISKIKNNRGQYLGGGLLLIAGVIALIMLTSKTSAGDKIFCIDSNVQGIELFNDYCLDNPEDYSNVEELIYSMDSVINQEDSDDPLSLAEQIKEMEKIDASKIDAPLIESLFYQEYGEMLLDNEEWDKAIDSFLSSSEIYSDNSIYSAKLNYSLSLAYFEKQDYKNASEYIEKALSCDFENTDLLQKIKYLKGKLIHKKA